MHKQTKYVNRWRPWSSAEPDESEAVTVLRRLDTVEQTVRYERIYTAPEQRVEYGQAFKATLQEWERALP